MSETLDYYKQFWAATEAAGIGYCEHCGAGAAQRLRHL
jgi:hypothetical protein